MRHSVRHSMADKQKYNPQTCIKCRACGKHIPAKVFGKKVVLFCNDDCLSDYNSNQSLIRDLRADNDLG